MTKCSESVVRKYLKYISSTRVYKGQDENRVVQRTGLIGPHRVIVRAFMKNYASKDGL